MERFTDYVQSRESCRQYDSSRPVEHEKLLRMVENARLAPSACNSQPWHFTVINGGELARETAKCLQDMGMNKFTDACPAFIIINEEKAKLSAIVGGRMKGQHYAGYDVGLAVAHLCFSALEEGLSTCIIGWFNEEKLKAVAGIGKDKKISLVLSVGYAVPGALRPKKRKELSEIVTFL